MFVDRHDAGVRLADRLSGLDLDTPVVLGLPRGGVVVAAPVARRLGAPLSVVIVRKLGVPFQPELAFGAIAEGGVSVIDQALVERLSISERAIRRVVERETEEARRRVRAYGALELELAGRTVVLVDDGLATGATMTAAVRGVAAKSPARIVVAVPVGARDAVRLVENEGAEVVVLEAPRWFGAVGAWYQDFDQTSDEEVVRLLRLTSSSSDEESHT